MAAKSMAISWRVLGSNTEQTVVTCAKVSVYHHHKKVGLRDVLNPVEKQLLGVALVWQARKEPSIFNTKSVEEMLQDWLVC